jgi:predicted nucleic acid-binding protein
LVGDIILVEVLGGFRSEKDFNTACKLLDEFPYRNMLGKDIAIQSAKYYRRLCKKGITIRKTIDLIIATFCIENNIQFLFSDKDYDPLVKHLGLRNASR